WSACQLSAKMERDVYSSLLALRAYFQPAFLECFQHRDILWQHFSSELLQPRVARKYGQMPQQRRPDALLLVIIDHNEGDLGRARPLDDIAPAGNDCSVAALFDYRHQGDMLRKIDIHEKGDLFVRKASLCPEETTVERLRTGPIDGCAKVGLVLRLKRANFEPTPVSHRFRRRISTCVQHQGLFHPY